MSDERILDIIMDQINRLEEKIDHIKDNMVTKENCENKQTNCSNLFQLKKTELTPAKLTSYAAIITAMTAGIAGIIKLFIGG